MTDTACNGSREPSSPQDVQRRRGPNTREICGVLVTPRQLDALRAIRASVEENGWPPTRIELCKALGVASTNGASEHIEALDAKGLISRGVCVSRGLRITDLGAKVLEEAGR